GSRSSSASITRAALVTSAFLPETRSSPSSAMGISLSSATAPSPLIVAPRLAALPARWPAAREAPLAFAAARAEGWGLLLSWAAILAPRRTVGAGYAKRGGLPTPRSVLLSFARAPARGARGIDRSGTRCRGARRGTLRGSRGPPARGAARGASAPRTAG